MKRLIALMMCAVALNAIGQDACPPPQDADGNGFIGSADLIDLLANFGDSDMDGDGIWDSEDECVGEYDECGVCNGEGPQIPVIQNIEVLYDSVYAEQIDEWWVFEVGIDTIFYYVCELGGCIDSNAENYNPYASEDDGSCSYACEVPLPYQGHSYQTVQIGDQCWFAENLRATHYPDGSPIQFISGSDNGAWAGNSNGAYCEYGPVGYYGYLYNWFAATKATEVSNDICPTGWHLPTGGEFTTLENYIIPLVGNSGNGDPVVGNALKEVGFDNNSCMCGSLPSCQAFDAFGFKGRGAGYRQEFSGTFQNGSLDGVGGFWATTSSGGRRLEASRCELEIGLGDVHRGWSVRCLKDSE